ncbi:putative phloem protein [Helianthus annuus]|uniref:Phloem protein n=1 Tax=Helianthus annuus TaxID=4232 RepID=A0A9K3E1U9_HELAN|nr:F-box protein PP2-B11 [Helianthus annuus]KAF5765480.1 putative phloem protein [Helianthus annuus]KAJ0456744.1 putative phloem protein [Helianthus annuus]KAJ0845700.1 putative phloem protein [Helianthus annuus]
MTESDNSASITDLPEGCVTDILSITSPRDACRAASISKAFNSAANSDAFWDRFLPPDYREIIARAVSPVVFESKKQLYISSLIMGLKLDRESGRKRYMLGARDLSIAWGNDARYWEWGHVPESRFAEVGILRNVWWLDIQGRIASAMLSPKTTYVVYLVYRITRDSWGLSAAGKSIVCFCGVRNEVPNVYLEQSAQTLLEFTLGQAHTAAMRKDGWMEIELGEFYCDNGDEGEVEMVFQEHHRNKGGLIVEGIELRPR